MHYLYAPYARTVDRKKLFLFLLPMLFFINCNSKPLAKEELTGTWMLNRIIGDGEVTFDRENPAVMRDNLFEHVKFFYKDLSAEDSLDLIKKAQENQAMYRGISYRFTADSVVYTNASQHFSVRGTYTFDVDKQEVICNIDINGPRPGVVFHIDDGRLIIGEKLPNGKRPNIQEFVRGLNKKQ